MATRNVLLLFTLTIPTTVLGIQVTPNSPCAAQCIDSTSLDVSDPNSSTTTASDVVCDDNSLKSTSAGIKWQQCMGCLQNSTFAQGSESDQGWFIYNLRYSSDHCIFNAGSNPCATGPACGALQPSLEQGGIDPKEPNHLGYCNAEFTSSDYPKCLACVSTTNTYVANALTALEAACLQKPNSTTPLGLNGTVVGSTIIGIVEPSAASKPAQTSSSPSLSIGAIAGIIFGFAVVLVGIAGFFFVRHRKAKNRSIRDPSWKKHRRQSSFSFRCRKIIGSPLSPKFFHDAEEEHHHQQQQAYSSLDEMAQAGNVTASPSQERRHITTRAVRTGASPASLASEWPRDNTSPLTTVTEGRPLALGMVDKKMAISISTQNLASSGGVYPPPSAYQPMSASRYSPQSSASEKQSYFTTPTSTTQLMPPNGGFAGGGGGHAPYNPADHVPGITGQTSMANSNSKINTNISPTTPKLSTVETMSPVAFSPRIGGIGQLQETPYFPPPPPRPESSGKNGNGGGGRGFGGRKKARKEAGSPVESRAMQIVFPGPPN